MDAYTGEKLAVISGQFQPEEKLKELNMNRTEWDDMMEGIAGDASFDTFRIPWPMEKADNNKRVDMRAYEWVDRSNPYMPKDSDYDFMPTASCYADPVENSKWRVRGGENIWDQMLDVVDHVMSID